MSPENPRQRFVKEFHKTQLSNVSRWQSLAFPSIWLLICAMALIVVGMVAVSSASMPEAASENHNPFFYIYRQGAFYGLGIILGYTAFRMGTQFYARNANLILLASLILLLMLYIPGIGHTVNGARRWLNLRVLNVQVGEVIKISLIIFTAAYLRKWDYKLDRAWRPIIVLLSVLTVFLGLLLLQPDFGTTAVVLLVILGMLFLSGVPLTHFFIIGILGSGAMATIAVMAPYRVRRLLSFIDPWKYKYDEGYQLISSLISFGRGGVPGVGIGEGLQKHQYLPEAHTDFIFSVIAEETGLIGDLVVIGIFAVIVWKAFMIGKMAEQIRNRFSRNLAYGIGLWIGIQTLINIGVTSGILPTKGITLPLISYGGSSVVMTCIALAILIRVDAETRFQAKREGILK